MTAQTTPESANRSHPYSAGHGGDNGGAQREDSPELLRWRADILMDEMMLGAVDVTAGQAMDRPREEADVGDSSRTSTPASATWPTSAYSAPPETPPSAPAAPDSSATDASSPATGSSTPEQNAVDEWWRKPFVSEPRQAGGDRPYSAAPRFDSSGWSGGLEASKPAGGEPGAGEPVAPAAGDRDGLLRPPSALRSSTSTAASGAPFSDGNEGRAYSAYGVDAPVPQRATRTNLLPRISEVDATALLREIDEMRTEIGDVVPPTHEWSVRSRHLLDKAESILRHHPERTAEVEYYLNQVRSIRDRVRQTYRWSQIYYRQLRLYLGAWIAFSALALAGALLYRQTLAELYTFFTGAPSNGFAAQSFAFWLAAPLAGALGGSLGALINMRRYRHLDHGFLDRKYSLRGLLLPIMALIAGLIFYAPFALAAHFLTPSGIAAWALALTPALLAFLYGFFQERLYGAPT